jgi:hypothetical protein
VRVFLGDLAASKYVARNEGVPGFPNWCSCSQAEEDQKNGCAFALHLELFDVMVGPAYIKNECNSNEWM